MSDEEKQISLFDVKPDWEEHWNGMPEYSHKDLSPKFQIIVSFENYEDVQKFAKLVDQRLTPKTQSIWYPEVEIGRYANKRYTDES